MTDTAQVGATSLQPSPSPAVPAGWAALAIAGIAQMLVMLDATVVNVALPSIGHDLRASPLALQWTVSGYVLTYGALLLFGGRMADSIGRRTAFVVGSIAFGAASLACGVAGNDAVLVGARIAQGVGAAVLSAAALSIIVSTYGPVPSQLKIALTVWSGLGVVGATLGVILGGVIVDVLSWRWAFLINLPVVVAVVVAALAWLAPMRPTSRSSLKVPTAIVATAGIGLVCYGLSRFADGISTVWPWALLVGGVVVLVALFVRESRSDDPLLPVSLLRTPVYAWAGFGLLLAATLMLGALYLSSNYLQAAHGMTPLETGFALLPLCLGSLISAFAIPALATKFGMTTVYLGGVVAQLLSLAAVIAATAGAGVGNSGLVIGSLAVFGLGLPTMFVPLYTFGSAPIPPESAGVGSGLLNTFNEAGAGVGLAIVAPIAAAVISSRLSGGAGDAVAAAAGANAGFWALVGVAALAGVTALVLTRISSTDSE